MFWAFKSIRKAYDFTPNASTFDVVAGIGEALRVVK